MSNIETQTRIYSTYDYNSGDLNIHIYVPCSEKSPTGPEMEILRAALLEAIEKVVDDA